MAALDMRARNARDTGIGVRQDQDGLAARVRGSVSAISCVLPQPLAQ